MSGSRNPCDQRGGRSTTSFRLRITERTTSAAVPRREKDRAATRSSVHRRSRRRTRIVACSVPRRGTEPDVDAVVCARSRLDLSVIASAMRGARDGTEAHRLRNLQSLAVAVSHAAIAGVLARDELSAGERLVAWSLASYANREQLAWPGITAAAARAALGRSRYLDARDQLVHRGLLEVEQAGRGRGQASSVRLVFAQSGPWWDGEVNAELVEAVLGYSRARGPARLLLAALAAISDSGGMVKGLVTEELCQAAGLANSTYRRARAALLVSGDLA
jgi:hypothetical protein